MSELFSRKFWVFLGLLGGLMPYLSSQPLISNEANLTLETGLSLYVQGALVNGGNGVIANDGLLDVVGDITNNSSMNLTSGAGQVALTGINSQAIGGSQLSRFHNLNLNNAAGLQLQQKIRVEGQLEMINGNLDLNGQEIDLATAGAVVGETNARRIFGPAGKVVTTRDLGVPSGTNIAGLGIAITSSANLGSTTIERAHGAQVVGSGNSIERTFTIIPTNNAGLGATLRLDFLADELNGQNPNNLQMWYQSSGTTEWTPGIVTGSGQDFVEGGPYDNFGQVWTLSSDGTSAIGDLLSGKDFSFYPNPLRAGEALTLKGLKPGAYGFRLYDLTGRIAWYHSSRVIAEGEPLELFLPALAKGMYSLQVFSTDPAKGSGLIRIQVQ